MNANKQQPRPSPSRDREYFGAGLDQTRVFFVIAEGEASAKVFCGLDLEFNGKRYPEEFAKIVNSDTVFDATKSKFSYNSTVFPPDLSGMEAPLTPVHWVGYELLGLEAVFDAVSSKFEISQKLSAAWNRNG